ncbi:MAG: hypothetical protein H3C62_16725 [Gemmatimonadaceae bacterium]|nr:hypothetical protein [Gemmatimonadaceae bacterium]
MLSDYQLRQIHLDARERLADKDPAERARILEEERELRLLSYFRAVRFWQFWGPALVGLAAWVLSLLVLALSRAAAGR